MATAADVLQMVKDNEVKFIDFRFTDTRGKEQHVSVPVKVFDMSKFDDGHAFDGSSIAGWKGIQASDMLLMPDPNSVRMDPFTDEPTLPPSPLPDVHRHFDPPTLEGATKVDILLTLPPAGPDGKSEFQVNGVPFWRAKPYRATVGERQIWIVKNDSKYAHPFHLHGFFMLPLDERLQPIRPMAWKDTINVPVDGTIRFLVDFNERPGMWMFHCHILDHADGGLMGHVHLEAASPTDLEHHKRPSGSW